MTSLCSTSFGSAESKRCSIATTSTEPSIAAPSSAVGATGDRRIAGHTVECDISANFERRTLLALAAVSASPQTPNTMNSMAESDSLWLGLDARDEFLSENSGCRNSGEDFQELRRQSVPPPPGPTPHSSILDLVLFILVVQGVATVPVLTLGIDPARIVITGCVHSASHQGPECCSTR